MRSSFGKRLRDLCQVVMAAIFIVIGASNAAAALELMTKLESSDFVNGDEAIRMTRCAFVGATRIVLFDEQSRKLYSVDHGGHLESFMPLTDIGIKESVPVSGLWGGENRLYVGLSGRDPELVVIDTRTHSFERQELSAGVYDLAAYGNTIVTVPMPLGSDPGPRVLIQSTDYDIEGPWGERCVFDLGGSDPRIELACLNRIALASEDCLYLASLNTGRCEKLDLFGRTVVTLRDDEPNWKRPTLEEGRRLTLDMVVLGIATNSRSDAVFILTSPKGVHHEHALEIYQSNRLTEIVSLESPYGDVISGDGDLLALVRFDPNSEIAIYRYDANCE